MIVLDASALLAFMFREQGHERVGPRLAEGWISTVNLSEVLARFARDGHPVAAIADAIAATGVRSVEFSVGQARLAAELAPRTRHLGLSLGDRACLALALSRGLPALTADAAWQHLAVGVPIELIR